jgi:hypothetical protein
VTSLVDDAEDHDMSTGDSVEDRDRKPREHVPTYPGLELGPEQGCLFEDL